MTSVAETINKQALERAAGNDAHSWEVIDASVERLFTYQEWNDDQKHAGTQVRDELATAYKAIVKFVPPGPTRTRSLNALIGSKLLANTAITFPGE